MNVTQRNTVKSQLLEKCHQIAMFIYNRLLCDSTCNCKRIMYGLYICKNNTRPWSHERWERKLNRSVLYFM